MVTALADRHTCRELLWVLAGEAKLAQLIRLPNIRGGMGRRREYWDNKIVTKKGEKKIKCFFIFLIEVSTDEPFGFHNIYTKPFSFSCYCLGTA